MAEIVNLNRYRKQQARRDAEKEAVANRARTGRTKAERDRLRRESDKAKKELDDKELD
jgi:hypothetical protein